VKRLLFLAALALCMTLSAENRNVCADRTPAGACTEGSNPANVTSPILKDLSAKYLSAPARPASEAATGDSMPNFNSVPEPLSLILIGSGLLAIAGLRRFRRP
jgi:PEP-CTERM motif-containing protein